MTRDEAIEDYLKPRLSRFNDTVMTTYCINELKSAQRRYERGASLPWFLESERSTGTEDITATKIALPDDFIREIEEHGMWFVASDGTEYPMRKMDYQDMIMRFDSTGTRCQAYALMGDYFYPRPIPDVGSTFQIRTLYYKKDVDLATNVENEWLKNVPELLIASAGRILSAHYTGDKNLAAAFSLEEKEAWQELVVANQARKDANREYWLED